MVWGVRCRSQQAMDESFSDTSGGLRSLPVVGLEGSWFLSSGLMTEPDTCIADGNEGGYPISTFDFSTARAVEMESIAELDS